MTTTIHASSGPASNGSSLPPPPAVRPAAAMVKAVKRYGDDQTGVRALDDVTVSFGQGQFTAIMGPSGSGKSTLLQCLAGLDRLTSGQAFIGNTELGNLNDDALTLLRRDRIGFIFQAFNLIPSLSAAENVALPMLLARRRPPRGAVDSVLTAVGLERRGSHRPSELSGGQQQRVAVARALLGKPELIFADEPTGNLDSRAGTEVMGLLRDAVDRDGRTVVMVTHDPIAAATSDRVVLLADGRIVQELCHPTADAVLATMKQLAA